MYMTILFFAIEGFTVPNFFEFIYYFAMNELKMSQIEWGMLMVTTTVSIIISTMIYSKFLRREEPRLLIKIMIACFMIAAFFNFCFITDVYLMFKVNRSIFLALFVFVPHGAGMAFGHNVPSVILAKITPSHVETTVFAFSTSVIKGSRQFGGFFFAILLNKYFIGMTSNNLKDLDKAILISVFFRLITFTYINMLPTLEQVTAVQAKLKSMNEVSEER
jgi:predicted MFS family arabinose efflux permease